MAERGSSGLLMLMSEPSAAVARTLPAEVREKLAELELELSEGESRMFRLCVELVLMMCVTAV